MSKISKTTAETIGIDLGDKMSHYCIVDETGQVVEEGRFRNQESSLRKHFGMPPVRIAMETGAQSAWISRVLRELGHEVIMAHARDLRWITQSNSKNDANDARKLALLAQGKRGLLTEVEHRSEQQQADLGALRARDGLVRARTQLVNTARGLAKGFGKRLPPSVTRTFGQRALQDLPQQLRGALTVLLEQIDGLSAAIANYDAAIQRMTERYPEVARLTTVPGVGTLTAMAFVLTLGRPERFHRSRDVGCYLGLKPRQQQSGARDPQLGITHAGSPFLRKLLVQCSHWILGHWGRDSALRRWGLSKAEAGRRATLRAIVAVARKLAVLLHRMWVSGDVYKPFPDMA